MQFAPFWGHKIGRCQNKNEKCQEAPTATPTDTKKTFISGKEKPWMPIQATLHVLQSSLSFKTMASEPVDYGPPFPMEDLLDGMPTRQQKQEVRLMNIALVVVFGGVATVRVWARGISGFTGWNQKRGHASARSWISLIFAGKRWTMSTFFFYNAQLLLLLLYILTTTTPQPWCLIHSTTL